jgi:hypothetical protein
MPLDTLFQDPEFQALPEPEQRKFLWENARDELFADTEQTHKLPTGLLNRLYTQESGAGTDPTTVKSETGVRGPFQITKAFWKDFAGDQPYSTDPLVQMDVAARGLAAKREHYGGDLEKAVAYYGGPTRPADYVSNVLGPKTLTAPGQAQVPTTLTQTTTTPEHETVGRALSRTLGSGGERAAAGVQNYLTSLTTPSTYPPAAPGPGQDPSAGATLARTLAPVTQGPLGALAKALSPVVAPTGSVGEVVAGTRARMRGATTEETSKAEERGGMVGAAVPLGVSLGARALTRLLPKTAQAISEGGQLASRNIEQGLTGLGQNIQTGARTEAGGAARGVTEAIGGRLTTEAGSTAESAAAAERAYSSRVVTQNEAALGRTVTNASGESAASAEALSRMSSEKAAGRLRYRVDVRSGKQTPLLGPDAVDATAGPNEVIIQHNVGGPGSGPTVLSQGGNVTDATVKRAGTRGYFTLPKPMTTRDYPSTFLAMRKENEVAAQRAVDYDRAVTQKIERLGPNATSVRLAKDPDLLAGIMQHATPDEQAIIQKAVDAGKPLSQLRWTPDQLSKLGEGALNKQGLFGRLLSHGWEAAGVLGALGEAGIHPGPMAATATVAGIAALKGFDALMATKGGLKTLQWLAGAPAGSLAAQAGIRALGQATVGPQTLQPPA